VNKEDRKKRRKDGTMRKRFKKVISWIWRIGKVVSPKPLGGALVSAGDKIKNVVTRKKDEAG
jgi:hypothetical protein